MGHLADAVKKGLEAGNKGDFDAVIDMLSPDIEFWDLGRPSVHGKADVRAALDRILVAFPDQKSTVRSLIESGDALVAEVTFTGTNLGPIQDPAGNEIPPTGKRITIEICHVIRFSEGKLASYRVYGDMLGVLMQLGLMPAGATAG